ncbi:hypothetical protein ACOMHN_065854 [Nucella lapillus]
MDRPLSDHWTDLSQTIGPTSLRPLDRPLSDHWTDLSQTIGPTSLRPLDRHLSDHWTDLSQTIGPTSLRSLDRHLSDHWTDISQTIARENGPTWGMWPQWESDGPSGELETAGNVHSWGRQQLLSAIEWVSNLYNKWKISISAVQYNFIIKQCESFMRQRPGDLDYTQLFPNTEKRLFL